MRSFGRRVVRAAACVLFLVSPAAFAGTVYGEVVTANKAPYQGKVSFIDETGHAETVTADAKGHYEVTLAPGHYRIESDAGSVSPATIDVFHEPRQQKIVVEAR